MHEHAAFWDHLAAHHGVIGFRSALELGVTRHRLRRLVEVGALESVAHGTFRATAHPRTFHQRVQVGLVATSRHTANPALPAAAARETAAWLWGIEPRSREPGIVHVVTPNNRNPAPDLGWLRVHRSRTITADHLTHQRGVWVTTPVRTTVDSAINRSVGDLADLAARALQRQLFTLDELSAQLESAGRIRGSTRLREAISRIAPDLAATESLAEAAAAQAFADANLDLVPQFPVEVDGRTYRLDFAAPSVRLAVEVDGHWWHSTPRQKARDDRRQNALAAHGWRVVRFGAGIVLHDPASLVEGVRTALATRWTA